MTGYIIAISLTALLLLFFRAKPSRIIYVKRLSLPLTCIVFIICLIAFSKTAVAAAAKGLKLWFDIVFPSLFPFFAASEILNATGFIKAAGLLFERIMRPVFNVPGCGSFAFLMGITSGYPVGAKITCDLRRNELVSRTEAERLLAFTNNSGPLFITGAVATGMYGVPSIGLFLLACHILACITVGILFRFYKARETTNGRPSRVKYGKAPMSVARSTNRESSFTGFPRELLANRAETANPGILFGNAVANSISLILAIGGYIILFSVIINILLDTGLLSRISAALSVFLAPLGVHSEIITSVLGGFFEITTGSKLASAVRGIPPAQQLAAASLIIGWAGLSVHSQVYSIVSRTDASIRPYLAGKLLQGVFAAIYCYIGVKILLPGLSLTQPVLNAGYGMQNNWLNTLLSSSVPMFLIIASYLCMFALDALIHKAGKSGLFMKSRKRS